VKNFLRFLLLFSVLFAFPLPIHAQSDPASDSFWEIELNDGSKVVGAIISEDVNFIQFKTLSGMDMKIPREQIKKIELVKGKMISGTIWWDDPNRTRLLFAPTGRGLKAKQGYFAVYEIFFPFVAYGITDWLTIAGGFSLFPGASSQLLYLAPKITPLRLEKLDLSGGVLYIKIPDLEDDEENSNDEVNSAGILYGVSTYGTEKSALTVGLGFAFGGGEIAKKPVFVLGGELRTSRSIKLITENWLIPDSDVQLLSAGIRFFGENLAVDFAFFYPAGADPEGFPFLPWLGFVYNFGGKK
jgi:hypothetical protein